MTPDEYAQLFLEDLELPNAEEKILDVDSISWNRAGYNIAGSPANLNLLRTLKNSFGRRIGLRRPTEEELVECEDKLKNPFLEDDEKIILQQNLEAMKRRMEIIPYLDPYDVRYTNFVAVPKPKFKAVMFCLMDVSGSMTEHMKDLAKRFYVILYRFLKVNYDKVDVVFIRHTHVASVVDEETFFYSPDTGGTVVSSGLKEVSREISEHYNPEEYNIYVAQVSDGDNTSSDDELTHKILTENILPHVQYYAYIETTREQVPGFINRSDSDLW